MADDTHFWGKLRYKDVLTDVALAACSDAAQTLYWRARCQAGASLVKGYLIRDDGKPKTPRDLAFEARRELAWAERGLQELAEEGLIRREQDGEKRQVWVVPVVLEDVANQSDIIKKRQAAGRASAAKRAKQLNAATGVEQVLGSASTSVQRALTSESTPVQPEEKRRVEYSIKKNRRAERGASGSGLESESGEAGEDAMHGRGANLNRVVGVSDPDFRDHWLDCARHAGMSDVDALEEFDYRNEDPKGPWHSVHGLSNPGGLLRHAFRVAERRRTAGGSVERSRQSISPGQRILILSNRIKALDKEIRDSVAFVSCPSDIDQQWYLDRTQADIDDLAQLRKQKAELEEELSALQSASC